MGKYYLYGPDSESDDPYVIRKSSSSRVEWYKNFCWDSILDRDTVPRNSKREGGVSSILGNCFLGEKNSKIQIIAYSN